YKDMKTILSLEELLTSSKITRSRAIPRHQNPWVLFRRNISKGSKGLNMSVGETSGVASILWKNKTDLEGDFWKELSEIAKEIHLIEYPDYKYTPVRSHEQNMSLLEVQINELEESAQKIIKMMISLNLKFQIILI